MVVRGSWETIESTQGILLGCELPALASWIASMQQAVVVKVDTSSKPTLW